MADTPTPTPNPHPARDDEPSQSVKLSHECPYRDEVHLIRRLASMGIEEQTIVGRRRDRIGTWLGGAALAAALGLGGWVYTKQVESAEAAALRDERIVNLQAQSASQISVATELGRLTERIEGIERRMGDRLGRIEQRLDRSEERPRRNGR